MENSMEFSPAFSGSERSPSPDSGNYVPLSVPADAPVHRLVAVALPWIPAAASETVTVWLALPL